MVVPNPVTVPTREIGYATPYGTSWWLAAEQEATPELRWPLSVFVYDRMRRSDAQTASVLRAVTLPVRRTKWSIDPAGARDEVTAFIAENMGLPVKGAEGAISIVRTRDRFSWKEHLSQALLEIVYGHTFFEQVYRISDDGRRALLRKLAPRLPYTIAQINVASDGGLTSIEQYGTVTSGAKPIPIPVSRLVAYVNDREGGNWLGQSLLRPAYKHWLIKDRLLRVQAQTIERNGMGVPIYTATIDGTDLESGKKMATEFRSGESAGGALPNGAQLELKGVTGELPDAEAAIRYHDEQIAKSVLAHFTNLGQAAGTGSYALGASFIDFFLESLQTLAEQIADVTQQHVIEDLVDVNFGPDEPAPQLTFEAIDQNPSAVVLAVQTLINAGAIFPDPALDAFVRELVGLPAKAPLPSSPSSTSAGSSS